MAQPTNFTPIVDLHPKLHNHVHDVKMYGAVGDGTTDDTAAIQAAITGSGWPSSRAAIYFPTGSYNINATGIVLDAGSVTSTPEMSFFGNNARLTTTTQSANPMLSITDAIISATYFSIRGLMFITNASSSPYRTAIRLRRTELVHIQDCIFGGNFGTGIEFDATANSNYVVIQGNTFANLKRGILFSGSGDYAVISDNTFSEGLGGGPLNWIESANGSNPTGSVVVSGNIFYGSGATTPIINIVNGNGWTIQGNRFHLADQEAIWVGSLGSSGNHSITGNVFSQGSKHDIYVNGGDRNTIVGNSHLQRKGGTAADTYNAITIKNTFGGAAGHHNVIMGNVSSDTASGLDQVVKLDAGCDYCVVVGNIGAAGFTAAGANNQVANNITH